jgi:hypothetical protein
MSLTPFSRFVICTATLALAFLIPDQGRAAETSRIVSLQDAVAQVKALKLLRDSTREISPVEIVLPGLRLRLESGRVAPLVPLSVGGAAHTCAMYFLGEAHMEFSAPVDVEQAQLRRFFHADTLVREIQEGLFVFSDRLYDSLFNGFPRAAHVLKKKHATAASELLADLFESGDDYLGVMLYRALAEPSGESFRVFNLKPRSKPRLYYLYDPFDRDEVVLRNYHDLPGESFMEVVTSYPREVTPDHVGINGHSKALLQPLHYDIDSKISMQGAFSARARVQFVVNAPGGRFEVLTLHSDLQVTSIFSSDSTPVDFVGHGKPKGNPVPLYVQWDKPLTAGDTVDLTFDYQGEVSREAKGYFYVTASALWYPSPSERGRATFDLHFATPSSYEFVSTGDLTSDQKERDRRYTRWELLRPARNVSFSIGPTDRFEFKSPQGHTVEVYYSADLHRDLLASQLANGIKMEKSVAADVMGALELFSQYFGPCPTDRLRVSEILAFHGEAFPGLLHMGVPTWVQTDSRGEQKLFRAHEVAHQWWGVEVGYNSYRDQWLSEGFAEYSALLYLERTSGEADMLGALARFRDDIFSVRSYAFGRGERSGAIALGYRASSTKTAGDFDLVVYKKGAYVLHMLRNLLTDPATGNDHRFFELLREFYSTYKGKDATTADFKAMAEKYAGEDLDWFFRQWLYGEELPVCKLEARQARREDGTWSVKGEIVTDGVDDSFRIDMPIEIEFDAATPRLVQYRIESRRFTFQLDGLTEEPRKVRLNPLGAVLAKTK